MNETETYLQIAAAIRIHAGAIERLAEAVENGLNSIATELYGIGQEIGWGLDEEDSRKNHI